MNKKILFTFPLAVSCLALFACNDGKVSKLNATVPSTNVYKRGGTISKSDFSVYAELSGGGQKEVKSNEWTSDKFGSSDTYTFTASGENTIDIKYGGQSCDVKVTVYPKGSIDFTFKDISATEPLKIKVDEIKTIEITMKEEGAEADISKVEWVVDPESQDPQSIQITPDTTNKFKCSVKGLKDGAASLNVKATDTVGNYKTNVLLIEVEDEKPAWQKYCQFDINGDNTVQVSVKNNIVRSTVVGALELPSKVDGKFVINGTAGTEYTVNKVANRGFQSCAALTSINIPGSVIEIDYGAFSGCSSLSTVTLNEGLERIQGTAFSSAKVTDFVIPSTVIELNGGALGHNDKHLTSLTFSGASKYWLIHPTEQGYTEAYYPSTDLLTKYNNNCNTYWEKCVIEFYAPAELIHLGRGSSGTVQISEGTIDWLYCSNQSVLEITGTAPNLSFNALKTGEATLTVKTTDDKYGYVAVTVDE